MVAFVPERDVERALAALSAQPLSRRAARIGRVNLNRPGAVSLVTRFGVERALDLPAGEPIPRIC